MSTSVGRFVAETGVDLSGFTSGLADGARQIEQFANTVTRRLGANTPTFRPTIDTTTLTTRVDAAIAKLRSLGVAVEQIGATDAGAPIFRTAAENVATVAASLADLQTKTKIVIGEVGAAAADATQRVEAAANVAATSLIDAVRVVKELGISVRELGLNAQGVRVFSTMERDIENAAGIFRTLGQTVELVSRDATEAMGVVRGSVTQIASAVAESNAAISEQTTGLEQGVRAAAAHQDALARLAATDATLSAELSTGNAVVARRVALEDQLIRNRAQLETPAPAIPPQQVQLTPTLDTVPLTESLAAAERTLVAHPPVIVPIVDTKSVERDVAVVLQLLDEMGVRAKAIGVLDVGTATIRAAATDVETVTAAFTDLGVSARVVSEETAAASTATSSGFAATTVEVQNAARAMQQAGAASAESLGSLQQSATLLTELTAAQGAVAPGLAALREGYQAVDAELVVGNDSLARRIDLTEALARERATLADTPTSTVIAAPVIPPQPLVLEPTLDRTVLASSVAEAQRAIEANAPIIEPRIDTTAVSRDVDVVLGLLRGLGVEASAISISDLGTANIRTAAENVEQVTAAFQQLGVAARVVADPIRTGVTDGARSFDEMRGSIAATTASLQRFQTVEAETIAEIQRGVGILAAGARIESTQAQSLEALAVVYQQITSELTAGNPALERRIALEQQLERVRNAITSSTVGSAGVANAASAVGTLGAATSRFSAIANRAGPAAVAFGFGLEALSRGGNAAEGGLRTALRSVASFAAFLGPEGLLVSGLAAGTAAILDFTSQAQTEADKAREKLERLLNSLDTAGDKRVKIQIDLETSAADIDKQINDLQKKIAERQAAGRRTAVGVVSGLGDFDVAPAAQAALASALDTTGFEEELKKLKDLRKRVSEAHLQETKKGSDAELKALADVVRAQGATIAERQLASKLLGQYRSQLVDLSAAEAEVAKSGVKRSADQIEASKRLRAGVGKTITDLQGALEFDPSSKASEKALAALEKRARDLAAAQKLAQESLTLPPSQRPDFSFIGTEQVKLFDDATKAFERNGRVMNDVGIRIFDTITRLSREFPVLAEQARRAFPDIAKAIAPAIDDTRVAKPVGEGTTFTIHSVIDTSDHALNDSIEDLRRRLNEEFDPTRHPISMHIELPPQELRDVFADARHIAEDQRGLEFAIKFDDTGAIDALSKSLDRDQRTLKVGVGEALRAIATSGKSPIEQLKLIKQLEEAIGKVDMTRNVKSLDRALSSVITVGRGVVDVADSLGRISDEARRVVTGIINATDALLKFRADKATGDVLGEVSSGFGIVAGLVPIAASIVNAIGSEASARASYLAELRRIYEDNQAKLSDLTLDLSGALKNIPDRLETAQAIVDPRVRDAFNLPGLNRGALLDPNFHRQDVEAFRNALHDAGTSFAEVDREAREAGIQLFDSAGNIIPGAFDQLNEAIKLTIQEMTHWANTIEDLRTQADLHANVNDLKLSPIEVVNSWVDTLKSISPKAFDEFFAGVDFKDSKALKEAEKRFLAAEELDPDLLQKLGLSKEEFVQILTGMEQGFDSATDAVNKFSESVRNAPQWFKLADFVFQAASPQLPPTISTPITPVVPTPPPAVTPPRAPFEPIPPNALIAAVTPAIEKSADAIAKALDTWLPSLTATIAPLETFAETLASITGGHTATAASSSPTAGINANAAVLAALDRLAAPFLEPGRAPGAPAVTFGDVTIQAAKGDDGAALYAKFKAEITRRARASADPEVRRLPLLLPP